ncbi:hypothetical protein V6N13_137491 [Hibiscus sabdariffa]
MNAEDEREFDYLESSEKGPKHWGELKKEWDACKKGNIQSPIDMTSDRVKVLQKSEELQMTYKPAEAMLKNRGHDIAVKWPKKDAGSIKINGTEYLLQQAHWHSPSEHTINGTRYALELHMVHQSSDPTVKNNLAVLGQLYEFGAPDKFLSMIASVSKDQVHAIRVAVHDYAEQNARPVQPLNLRGIELYDSQTQPSKV